MMVHKSLVFDAVKHYITQVYTMLYTKISVLSKLFEDLKKHAHLGQKVAYGRIYFYSKFY